MEKVGSAKAQYLAATYCGFAITSYGAMCGWPSPTFPILQSENTPLDNGPLNNDQVSWIGSVLCLGGLIGTWVYGYLMDKIGRKMCIISTILPQIVSWSLVFYAKSEILLYLARILGGFVGGGLFVVVPIFLAEIAETKIRGFLGSTVVLSANIGIFLAFVAGAYLDYCLVPVVLLPLSFMALIGCVFMSESPPFLAKNGRYKEAEEALKHYRGFRRSSTVKDDIYLDELSSLKDSKNLLNEESSESQSISINDFRSKPVIKSLIIGMGLIFLNQLCGLFAMLNYTVTIFQAAGSTLSPKASAIIVGFIQMLGTFAPTILVEKAGRKILMIISASGICLGQVCLGTYCFLDFYEYDVSSFTWLPLFSFAFAIFIGSWGVMSLPFLIISEITPPKLRAFSSTFSFSILWTISFGMIKCLPFLMEKLEMYGTMYLFASFCLLGTTFIVILMPETKGKSFDEITKILE